MKIDDFYDQKVSEVLQRYLRFLAYAGDGTFVSDRVDEGVRIVLELMARAWDEGNSAGYCEGREGFSDGECTDHDNPYKENK